MMYDVLVFDLDGTLSDPQIGITKSLNYALEKHGYDTQCEKALTRYIGPPLDVSFRDLVKDADEEHIASLVFSYRERYADIGYRENNIYAGTENTLEHFKKAGYRMGICTSKPKRFAMPILEMFGIDHYFSFVSGGDVGVAKASQLAELKAAGEVTEQSLMIGDRAVDIASAKANGLKSAGVLWGFGDFEELNSEAPDHILQEVVDLKALVSV